MNNHKTRRCKFFTNDGKPSGGGCYRGTADCRNVHPDEPEWANLPPVHSFPLARAGGSGSFHSSHASASGLTGSNDEPLGSSARNAWGNRPNNVPRTASVSSASASWGPQPDWQGQANASASATTASTSQPSISNLEMWGGANATSTSGWGSPQRGWGSPNAPKETTSWEDIALARKRASGSGQNDSAASPPHAPAQPAQSPKASTSNTLPAVTPSVRRTSGANAPWSPVVPTAAPQQAAPPSPTRSYTMGSPTRLYQLLYPEAGMLRAPARLSEESMNIDVAPAPKEPLEGPVAEWSAYLGAIMKTITIKNSLDDTTRRYQILEREKNSPWYQEFEPDFAAYRKLTTQLETMQKEIEDLKIQYGVSLRHLQAITVPAIPASTDEMLDLEKEAEELRMHIVEMKEWLDNVPGYVETYRARAQAAPLEDLTAKVEKLEDKMSGLEEYAGELSSSWSVNDRLTEKLQGVQKNLSQTLDEHQVETLKSDFQGTQDQVAQASSHLTNTRAEFGKFKEEQSTAQAAYHMGYYRAKFEELQRTHLEAQQAYQANSTEIARLRSIIDNLTVQQSSAPPLPQFTREDILGMVTPILVQRARADIAEAVEDMHDGIEKALQEYSDNMAVEVWRKMDPIVKLVHVMKGKVDSIVGRASNSE